MRLSFAFDTAALVSLGHTELIDSIVNQFKIVVTTGIIDELENIGKQFDDDAKAAKKWFDVLDRLTVIDVERKEHGEDELFEICQNDDIFLITDDIKAIKRYRNAIRCYYSIHIVYILYRKSVIQGNEPYCLSRR